jgi:hypothetical protein
MVQHPVQSTVGLLPDPVAISAHINRLNTELKLARRLLRLVADARLRPQRGAATERTEKREAVSHAS